jgi:HSP20 family protein
MTIIRRTTPRMDLMSFRGAVDRLLDDNTFRPLARGSSIEARLPLDITSTEDAILVEAALPGIAPEDVEITAHQDTLTIGVKEQVEQDTSEGKRVHRELRRSSGSRTLTLPSGLDMDQATADFENGMLRIAIPRAEAAKPRQIPVNAVAEGHVATGTEAGNEADAQADAQA